MSNKSRRRRRLRKWDRYALHCQQFDIPAWCPNGLVKLNWNGYHRLITRVLMDQGLMRKAKEQAVKLQELAD